MSKNMSIGSRLLIVCAALVLCATGCKSKQVEDSQSSGLPEETEVLDEFRYLKIAEEYTANSIEKYNALQVEWRIGWKDAPEEPGIFVDSRVDVFEYICTLNNYKVFHYFPGFYSEEPDRIREIGGFEYVGDGWFSDRNCLYFAVNEKEPESAFTFRSDLTWPSPWFEEAFENARNEKG